MIRTSLIVGVLLLAGCGSGFGAATYTPPRYDPRAFAECIVHQLGECHRFMPTRGGGGGIQPPPFITRTPGGMWVDIYTPDGYVSDWVPE